MPRNSRSKRMPSLRLALAAGSAAAVAAAGAARARAQPDAPAIDVELAPRSDVRGTVSEEAAVYRYAAAPGSSVSVTVRTSPAGASDLDLRLSAPGGADVPLAGAPRFVERPGLVSFRGLVLAAAGTYTLRLAGTGAASYRMTFAATPGPRRVRRTDLRCATLGRTPGAETAFGRIALAGVPTALEVVAGDSDLLGAEATIPADGIAPGTQLVLVSRPAPSASRLPAHLVVGPAAGLLPAGAATAGATLTLPFDPLLLPAGTDASADLRVAATDRRGRVALLAPDGVDTLTHTATVAAGDHVAWAVVAPKAPPDPASDEVWHGSLGLELQPAPSGSDSRARGVNLDTGRASFAPGGTLAVTGDSHSIEWWHDDAGTGGVADTTGIAQSDVLTWEFLPDGRRVRVRDPGGGGSVLEPSEDGTAWVGQIADDTASPQCTVELALRRAARAPEPAALAGTYWLGTLEIEAEQSGESAVRPRVVRSFGTVVLRADGTWTATGAERASWVDQDMDRVRLGSASWSDAGTWTVLGPGAGWREGSLELRDAAKPSDLPMRVFPSANGLAFFGTNDPSAQGHCAFFVGLRRAASLARRSVTGSFASTELGTALDTFRPAIPDAPVLPDIHGWQMESRMTFDGTARLRLPVEIGKDVSRDVSAPGGVRVAYGPEPPPGPVRFSLSATGKLVVRAGSREEIAGAISPDGRIGFASIAPSAQDGGFGLRVFVKSPPGE